MAGEGNTEGIYDNVSSEIKTAMKAKDTQKLSALRGIRSVLQAATKEANKSTLTNEECVPILRKLAKQRWGISMCKMRFCHALLSSRIRASILTECVLSDSLLLS